MAGGAFHKEAMAVVFAFFSLVSLLGYFSKCQKWQVLKHPQHVQSRKHKFNKISALHWVTHLMEAGSVNLGLMRLNSWHINLSSLDSASTLTTWLCEVSAATEYLKDFHLMIGSGGVSPDWQRGRLQQESWQKKRIKVCFSSTLCWQRLIGENVTAQKRSSFVNSWKHFSL